MLRNLVNGFHFFDFWDLQGAGNDFPLNLARKQNKFLPIDGYFLCRFSVFKIIAMSWFMVFASHPEPKGFKNWF